MLKVTFLKVEAKPAFKPLLTFNVNVTNTATTPPMNLALLDLRCEILMENKCVGESQCHTLLPRFLSPQSSIHLELTMDVDYSTFDRIERQRKGEDLVFSMDYRASVGLEASSTGTNYGTAIAYTRMIASSGMAVDFAGNSKLTAAKSDWVEKILPAIGLDKVVLLELPAIEPLPEFNEAFRHYENARKHYYLGSYAETLTSCRKSFESIKDAIKKYGYIKDDEIDFEKLYNSEKAGEGISSMFRGAWTFFNPAAHAGRAINREDAELALSVTHGVFRGIAEILRKRISGS